MGSKYTGCLIGLAVGDALGAPVEFLTLDEIKSAFGPRGIEDFQPWEEFAAGSYTDDTQMSLAAAQGCLDAYREHRSGGPWDIRAAVYREYQKWRNSQSNPMNRKAPGLTCLLALREERMGTIEAPINDSKGCGGVMRTAPAGLVFKPGQAFRAGAEFAAMTHGHPSGYLSAGFLSEVIARLTAGESLGRAVARAVPVLKSYPGHKETLDKIGLALHLYSASQPAVDAIGKIGEGWTGEEALAISLYCALKFPKDFRAGVLAAVNQEGDSDSTGSITGALLGTALGLPAIPKTWVARLQNRKKILALAAGLEEAFGGSGRIDFV
jgi:ADP-ribosylglycohydrolase